MKRLICLLMLCPGFALGAEVEWGPIGWGENVSILRVPGKVIPKEGALSIESARIQGRVTSILKREGEHVQTGEPLFLISSAECISLTEEKRVAEDRGLQELIAGAKVREEQLGIDVAGGQCRLLATHSGTIVKRQIELGAAFNVGDALATVLDVGNLNVELDLPERDQAFIKSGQQVKIQLPAYPGRFFEGHVERILPSIDPQTRTLKVRLSNIKLPAGTTLDALVLAEIDVKSNERVLKVPTTALVFHDNQQYVVKNSSRPTAVPVEVVNETENESSVRPWKKDDLRPTDEIAIKGAIFVFGSLKNNIPLK